MSRAKSAAEAHRRRGTRVICAAGSARWGGEDGLDGERVDEEIVGDLVKVSDTDVKKSDIPSEPDLDRAR